MSPGIVTDDIIAKFRCSDLTQRLAFEMDERHRQRKAGDLQTFLADLEAKVRVLEIPDKIFLVEAADRFINFAPYNRAPP
jgi:hypothetical protein